MHGFVLLLKVCVVVCVCVREREKEGRLSLEESRDFVGPVEIRALHLCPRASVCVWFCVACVLPGVSAGIKREQSESAH